MSLHHQPWGYRDAHEVTLAEDAVTCSFCGREAPILDPLSCDCGHRHWASTDGEDSGCPCEDGHDWHKAGFE